jgi:nucleoside-diphosphate-sugar epimerase
MGGIAILGAGGFVGARYVEMAALAGRTDIVPVVRAFKSVARNAHIGVAHRLGDASRRESLERALSGCDAVVNLTMGDDIVRTTESIYAAAVAARARVLVHISSAIVFGKNARPDLPDDALPQLDHWMPYAREKARAENFLRERMADGRIAIVVLRPSVIWGPGSPWVLGPATELMKGSAYLIGGGEGICNLMYVDDLVRSIDAVVASPVLTSGFFNVGDDQPRTWRDYYAALAAGLGVDTATIVPLASGEYHVGIRDRLGGARRSAPYQWIKDRFSIETRESMKLQLRRLLARRHADASSDGPRPVVTRTMWDLQTTPYASPTAKYRATFGHQNRTSFDAGLAASLAWLDFLGLGRSELSA